MDQLIQQHKSGNLHHAYVIEGAAAVVVPELVNFLNTTLGFTTVGNPDFSLIQQESFLIDDSRALREAQLRRGLEGRKIFILSFRFINMEAQNALLKVLEEPTEGTHFFIVVDRAEIFLPTIRSRVLKISHASKGNYGGAAQDGAVGNDRDAIVKLAKQFLKAGAGERIVLVKEIVEDKDKGKAIDFVRVVAQLAKDQKLTAEQRSAILTTEKYLGDRGASVKLLLEGLALGL